MARLSGRKEVAGSFAVLLAATFVAGCSPDGGPTPTPPAQPSPRLATVTREEYISLFNAFNLRLLEDTRVMNQIAIATSRDEQARIDFEDTARLILEDLDEQLGLLKELEPVPSSVVAAHESLKAAMMRYIEATSLLLPPQGSQEDVFDFFAYQALVAEGGKYFHGAGNALSTNNQ